MAFMQAGQPFPGRKGVGSQEIWTKEKKNELFEIFSTLNELITDGEMRDVIDYVRDKELRAESYKVIADDEYTFLSPVATAAKYGKVEIMNYLIAIGFDVNDKYHSVMWGWRQPIHLAALSNEITVVKCLVEEHNVDINCKDSEGITPLVWTMLMKEHTETAKYLIDAGAAVNNPCGENKNTPLLFASHHARFEIAKHLMLKDADVNARNSSGNTPFTVALEIPDSIELVSAMLDAGANVNMSDFNGDSPLHTAIRSSDEENLDLVKLLCTRGADVNDPDANDNTPIHLVAEFGFSEIARYLVVDMNVCLSAENVDEWTPFVVAFQERHIDIIELIVARGHTHGFECAMDYDYALYDSEDSEEWKTLVARLQKIGSNPLPLKTLCIREICDMLSSGTSFMSDLESLCLPYTLMNDILMK